MTGNKHVIRQSSGELALRKAEIMQSAKQLAELIIAYRSTQSILTLINRQNAVTVPVR